jgi:chaperonin cofactor prefoldin
MRRNTSQIDRVVDEDSDVADDAPSSKGSGMLLDRTDRKMPLAFQLEDRLRENELALQAWEKRAKELQDQIQVI